MNETYWGLSNLSKFIRWLEELVAILSRPFLMVGFVISMVDLLTQGRLLTNTLIIFGWALVQAVAVDASFFVTWARVSRSWREKRVWNFIGFFILGTALGIVAWAAMDIQSLQQALNLTNVQALEQLGLNITLLTHLRSAVAIGLAAVIAMLPHKAVEETVNNNPRGPWFTTPKWLKRRLSKTPNQADSVDRTNQAVKGKPNQTNQAAFTEPTEPAPNQTDGDSEPEPVAPNQANDVVPNLASGVGSSEPPNQTSAVANQTHQTKQTVLVNFHADRAAMFSDVEEVESEHIEPEPVKSQTQERIITVNIPRIQTIEPNRTEPPNLYIVPDEPNPIGKREMIKQVLTNNRNATLQQIMDITGASKGYASQVRSEVLKELYGEQAAVV